MELTLEQALQRGIEAHKAGRVQEAEGYYNAILNTNPKNSHANHNLGILSSNTGRLDKASTFFRCALEADPKVAQFWLSYIDALIKLEQLTDAQGMLDAAKRNIVLDDRFSEIETILDSFEASKEKTHGNQIIGKYKIKKLMDLYGTGRIIEAKNEVRILLREDPENINFLNINALLSASLGRYDDAIKAYERSFELDPQNTETLNNFGSFLKNVKFEKPLKNIQEMITQLLDQKYSIRPIDIARSIISLLKHEPRLKIYLAEVELGSLSQSIPKVVTDLCQIPLLLKLMALCPVPDLQIEKLLSEIRAKLITISFKDINSPDILKFQSAMAMHCFVNEYLFNCTKKEKEILESIEKLVEQSFRQGSQPDAHLVLCLASYQALNKYRWSNRIISNPDISAVFNQQIAEPQKEHDLKMKIAVFGNISNSVSKQVKQQYEENPYPRWINTRVKGSYETVSQLTRRLKLNIHDPKIRNIVDPKILIAGCGTGQHAIYTATRIKDSSLVAVDLSLASLAYAQRKFDELDVQNIDFINADLLQLENLNQKFDIVECLGTLVCIEKPFIGWKILKNCLKSGGLMKIGLYSELARQHIVKIRKEISDAKIGPNIDDIRSFRNMLIQSGQEHHKKAQYAHDFYSISELRDMLFHVHEIRFTIPQIKDYLNRLNLRFCGFENSQVLSQFKKSFTGTFDIYDLDKWQLFEEANPDAFIGMYQFWCQKTD